MGIPLSWLAELLPGLPAVEELVVLLLRVGLEVEEVQPITAPFSGVYVGRIAHLEMHPTNSHLVLAQVDVGSKGYHRVVCGAPNIIEGARVPIALPGAKLPETLIEARDFDGLISEGMLCSRIELGLEKELLPLGETGIAILPEETEVGANLASILALPDTVLQIKATANRPDWLSVQGLAREMAVFLGYKLQALREFPANRSPEQAESQLSLQIADLALCPRYLARIIREITIGESPLWIKSRLWKSGLRPINNVVDATNYVMLEVGQPLHAFDRRQIAQNKIIVRRAEAGESITTLDNIERTLEERVLLIADPTRPLAIAGVMGGLDSEVAADTREVVLESALFAANSIRRTARLVGLRTEASQRFGRGANMAGVEEGSLRAAEMIACLGKGELLAGVVDAGKREPKRFVSLRPQKVNELLESRLSADEIGQDLERLHFKLWSVGERLEVEVPAWRTDVREEVDLIEDLARLTGYDRIPVKIPSIPLKPGAEPPWRRCWPRWRERFLAIGLQEAFNLPLVGPANHERTFLVAGQQPLKLRNPISPDRSVLRLSLIPSLLDCLSFNLKNGNSSRGFFELGKAYLWQGETQLPQEPRLVSLVMPVTKDRTWKGIAEPPDFFDLKGLLISLNPHCAFRVASIPHAHAFHPGRSAGLFLQEKLVAVLGELTPNVLKHWELRTRILAMELYLEPLLDCMAQPSYLSFSHFPPISRDISIIVPDELPYIEVEDAIRGEAGPFLACLTLFDHYRGEGIPAGRKSLSFSLVFRHLERTLTEEEVLEPLERIYRKLAELGGVLRQ
jgi:phenylalanyl-tRNA synthetase beta chain